VVAGLVGLLLLSAAGLKLYGFRTGPVSPQAFFGTPVFQVALVEFELFLGLWLLWGKQPIGAWSLTVFAFGAFAGVSFYQGSLGQVSCNCFGKLLVNPWVAFGIDVAVLAGLFIGRPDFSLLWFNPREVVSRLVIVVSLGLVSLGVLALVLLVLARFRFGSLDGVLAALRGETLSVRPSPVDLGTGSPGEEHEAVLTVINHTEDSVRIVGGTSDCSCVATMDLPVAIPAHDSSSIRVRVRFPAKTGTFTRQSQLSTDSKLIGSLHFTLRGRAIRPAKATAQVQVD
jgi:hypothetical protein